MTCRFVPQAGRCLRGLESSRGAAARLEMDQLKNRQSSMFDTHVRLHSRIPCEFANLGERFARMTEARGAALEVEPVCKER